MKYDEILVKYVGEFGRYQKVQFLLVLLPIIFVSMQALSWTFTGANLPHRCWYSDENDTFAPYRALKSSLNYTSDIDEQLERLQCYRFANITSPYEVSPQTPAAMATDVCDKWKYDHSETEYSAINRWNVVCGRRWLRAMVQSMYYIGQAGGSVFFGYIGDQWGRKAAFIIAIGLQCLSGTLMAFTPWIELFAILRMVVGFCHPGVFVVSTVIGMELVGPKKRYIGGIGTGLFFAFGQIALGGLAYGIRNYQYLQLIISVPYFIFAVYWWVVPESSRWLISRGRIEDAEKILSKAAKWNKRHLPENWYQDLDGVNGPSKTLGSNSNRRYTFLDIFRYSLTRRRAIIQFFCWPSVSMVYYGLSMNPSFLGGNPYVSFILAGLAEVPGIVFASFTINRLGRKALAMSGFGLAGVMLMLTLIVPDGQVALLTVLVTVAKMAITMVYAVEYTWTPELFPTVIRNQTMGLCSMMARIGGVAASYLIMLLVDYSKVAVVLIFGACSLTATFLSLLQPETANAPLLESMEDAEAFSRNTSVLSFKVPEVEKNKSADETPLRQMVNGHAEDA